jgi:hypothetical protein
VFSGQLRLAIFLSLANALLLTTPCPAASDFVPLNPSSIRGKTVMLDEGSSLEYRSDGVYVYTIGGRAQHGTWRIGPNGSVCADFPNGRGRCDFYLENGSSLYLRNSYGKLFKVRFAK